MATGFSLTRAGGCLAVVDPRTPTPDFEVVGTFTDNLITYSTISSRLRGLLITRQVLRTFGELQITNAAMLSECLPAVQIPIHAKPFLLPTVVIVRTRGRHDHPPAREVDS
jgi:hypothetical protein